MEPMLRFLLILQASCCCCFGWRQFESPLELAQPNSDGIYEFDLLVEQKLTMSSRENGGEELRLAQFNVDQAGWSALGQNGTFGPEKLETGWQDLLQLDGRHTRVLTINGHSPGQVLVVPLDAKVAMKVRNRLPGQAMTIHLHGMDKLGAWWTDGVAFVQQCPIQPGQDFVYRFIADTPGTLWYHGHLMNDRADGLLGGFVVKQLNETAPPELDGQNGTTQLGRDYYAILQDWSTVPSTEQWICHVHTTMKWLHGFDEPTGNQARQKCWAPKRTYDTSNIGGSVPLSAILLGEKGWHSQEDIRERPSHLPLTTFPIKKGENVRLRLVNGGISQGFMIWAEGHEVWVLAADGAPVKPRKIDALIIYPGERYDILIKGLDAPTKQRFWLQIETMEVINWDWSQDSPQLGLARLHYEDFAEVAEAETEEEDLPDWSHSQCTAQRKCLVLNCPFGQFPAKLNLTCLSAHLLESAEPLEDRELVEQKVFPADKFHEEFANMHSDNHIEGWMFSHPSGIPYFHEGHLERVARPCDPTKCDHENSTHWEKACQCFVHFNFSLGSIVQLTIYNMGDMANPHGPGYSHPIHVHGTHFLLVKVGYGGYHADGSIRTMNPDIPCTDPNSRCIGLRWANDSWLGGNVPDMVANPSWRDTVNIPSGGYITIRFRAKNPGWWFAHCHLMLHNMGGTAFAFRVGSHQQVPKPPDSYPHSCGIYQEP